MSLCRVASSSLAAVDSGVRGSYYRTLGLMVAAASPCALPTSITGWSRKVPTPIIEFYKKAFGLEIRDKNRSAGWVEMETGATTLAFTPWQQHETDLTGGVAKPSKDGPSPNVEINLIFPDVEAAYKDAISQGAEDVARPEDKMWGQKVCYVRDVNGNVVRMGSVVGDGKLFG